MENRFMRCSSKICAYVRIAKQKEKQKRPAFIVKFAAYIMIMSIAVRSW